MGLSSSISKIFSFIGGVRQELNKVTWSTRKEIIVTTLVVFFIAIIASIFFSIVDTVIYKIVHSIIGR
ncbi:MAG: preprotein translocase subunit SecE [Streptococcaceae bacterium]|jgi:preprotein translocase subunit SecE|nr:preprotein translocase subunit SecE [Streptococcaceae bacterium]